jgi:hypothetical protein
MLNASLHNSIPSFRARWAADKRSRFKRTITVGFRLRWNHCFIARVGLRMSFPHFSVA